MRGAHPASGEPLDAILERLDRLLTRELHRSAGVPSDLASMIASQVLDAASARSMDQLDQDAYLSPEGSLLVWWRHHVGAALTCARATGRCPGGPSWWYEDGFPALACLLEGLASEAETEQAEILAGPFDREVDFNWPASRVLERYPDLNPGTSFVAGDGEGNRARYCIYEEGGVVRAEMESDSWRNPTDDLWSETWRELTELLDVEGAKAIDAERWFRAQGFALRFQRSEEGWSTSITDSDGREVKRYGPSPSKEWAVIEATMLFPWRDRDDGV